MMPCTSLVRLAMVLVGVCLAQRVAADPQVPDVNPLENLVELEDKCAERITVNADFGNTVYLVNGIWNNRSKATLSAKVLSDRLQRSVCLIYNPTSGRVADLREVMADAEWTHRKERQHNLTTKAVAGQFLHAAKNGESLSIVAHSQGTLIVRNAVQTLCHLGYGDWVKSKLAFIAVGSPLAAGAFRDHEIGRFFWHADADDPVPQILNRFSAKGIASSRVGNHQFLHYIDTVVSHRDVFWPGQDANDH